MRRLLLLGAVLALCAPATASAADTNLTFSGIADFTTINDQFSGSDGVRFGSASTFGFPTLPTFQTCGSPFVQAGKLNGAALAIDCRTGSNEFPDRRFNTAIEFAVERRQASFNITQHTSNTQNVTVKYYAIGNAVLHTETFSLAPNAVRSVGTSYSHAADGGIIGIQVYGDPMDYSDSGGVWIDDLQATVDPTPPPKKYTVAMQTPTVDVVEGSSVDAKVSVRRYNGSDGPVSLAVGTLPSSIASASFSPSSVTGTDPATLHVTAKSPFTGSQQLTVSASGGGGAGTGINTTGLIQTINGQTALYFATGGRSPLRLVPGCGQQKFTDSVNVRGDFSGYTSFNFGGTLSTSGLDRLNSQTDGSSIYPSGNGTYPFSYILDPGTADGSGTFNIEMDPYGASKVTLSQNWISDRLTIDSAPDLNPALPLRDGGSTIRVIGNFPANCPVTFKDALDQTWGIRSYETEEINGKQYDEYILNLPASAVTGPIRALNNKGVEMARTPTINVREYRQQYGFEISNSSDGGSKGTYSWDDFEHTFGTDDTEACFVFCVHDPVASDYYDTFKTDVEAGTGLCFGYATMSARFRGYSTGEKFANYASGANRAWDLLVYPDSAIKKAVVRWFVAQNDKSFLAADARGRNQSPADERKLLKDLIAQQGAALVSIRQGDKGHEVLAYGERDTGDGGMILEIYDSNIPYQQFEQTDAKTRSDALTRSEITVAADGSWSGASVGWMGPNSTLVVNPNIPPDDAKLPSDFSLSSLFSSSGGPSPAAVSGIDVGGKAQLDSDGVPVDGSNVDLRPSLSGNGAAPKYDLAKGHEYELTIRGTGKGSYDSSTLAGNDASVRGVDTKPGQVDHVTVRPGQAALGFETGASSAGVTYDLKAKAGKATRTATIATTAREGGGDEAELGGGVLRIAHDGAATKATITLGSVGAGLPGTVQTAPMVLGKNQRLEAQAEVLEPACRWRALHGQDEGRQGRAVGHREAAHEQQGRGRLGQGQAQGQQAHGHRSCDQARQLAAARRERHGRQGRQDDPPQDRHAARRQGQEGPLLAAGHGRPRPAWRARQGRRAAARRGRRPGDGEADRDGPLSRSRRHRRPRPSTGTRRVPYDAAGMLSVTICREARTVPSGSRVTSLSAAWIFVM